VWVSRLVTKPPVIRDGHIWLSDAPGWGADINESVHGMDPEQMS
jgi:L-alanine-DL-glutamate epimerase-like enolase superfamily enzyme